MSFAPMQKCRHGRSHTSPSSWRVAQLESSAARRVGLPLPRRAGATALEDGATLRSDAQADRAGVERGATSTWSECSLRPRRSRRVSFGSPRAAILGQEPSNSRVPVFIPEGLSEHPGRPFRHQPVPGSDRRKHRRRHPLWRTAGFEPDRPGKERARGTWCLFFPIASEDLRQHQCVLLHA